jgi:type II secretory pathway pseudopilin PulG
VIVIIGILAAMAIPRLSGASAGASDAALSGNLQTIRGQIEAYAVQHRGVFPGPTAEDFLDQLTMYTDINGNTSATSTTTHIYGPYLRRGMPKMPIGDVTDPTAVLIDASNSPPAVTTSGEGWVYNPTTGEIIANTNETDQTGTAYSEY